MKKLKRLITSCDCLDNRLLMQRFLDKNMGTYYKPNMAKTEINKLENDFINTFKVKGWLK